LVTLILAPPVALIFVLLDIPLGAQDAIAIEAYAGDVASERGQVQNVAPALPATGLRLLQLLGNEHVVTGLNSTLQLLVVVGEALREAALSMLRPRRRCLPHSEGDRCRARDTELEGGGAGEVLLADRARVLRGRWRPALPASDGAPGEGVEQVTAA